MLSDRDGQNLTEMHLFFLALFEPTTDTFLPNSPYSYSVWLGDTSDKRKISGNKRLTLVHDGERLIYDQYYISDYNIAEGDTLVIPGTSDLAIAQRCQQVTIRNRAHSTCNT